MASVSSPPGRQVSGACGLDRQKSFRLMENAATGTVDTKDFQISTLPLFRDGLASQHLSGVQV